uniref:Uncharacterized protein n=1 Tax=Glossina pallidipes TaxID=7398 RepID=A0A1A9ZNK3_GLOPL
MKRYVKELHNVGYELGLVPFTPGLVPTDLTSIYNSIRYVFFHGVIETIVYIVDVVSICVFSEQCLRRTCLLTHYTRNVAIFY